MKIDRCSFRKASYAFALLAFLAVLAPPRALGAANADAIEGPGATVTRSFKSAQDAARENAYSRMLVGIHFRRACTVGLQQGREVGHYVLEHAKFLHD